MGEIKKDTPIWQLTVGQLTAILSNISTPKEANPRDTTPELVYGIIGIANTLGISKSQVQRLKKKGIFNDAISQRGRTIIADKQKIITLFKEHSDYE